MFSKDNDIWEPNSCLGGVCQVETHFSVQLWPKLNNYLRIMLKHRFCWRFIDSFLPFRNNTCPVQHFQNNVPCKGPGTTLFIFFLFHKGSLSCYSMPVRLGCVECCSQRGISVLSHHMHGVISLLLNGHYHSSEDIGLYSPIISRGRAARGLLQSVVCYN